MRRSLITLAVVAGLAAILLAALALVDMVPRPNPADRQAPPVVTGHAAQSAAWAQPVKTTRVIEATDSATDLAAESAEPAATETAAGDQAAAEPAKGEPAVLSAVDCEAFVKDLSDEQSAELYVLLRTRRAYRDVKQRQRALMTDTKLQVLGMSRPELALTEVQKQRASAIKETLMPRMEPLLAEVWAKQDELVKKFQEALRGPRRRKKCRRSIRRTTISCCSSTRFPPRWRS